MRRHYHAYICPLCGAYLDPDEKCDCQEEETTNTNKNNREEK